MTTLDPLIDFQSDEDKTPSVIASQEIMFLKEQLHQSEQKNMAHAIEHDRIFRLLQEEVQKTVYSACNGATGDSYPKPDEIEEIHRQFFEDRLKNGPSPHKDLFDGVSNELRKIGIGLHDAEGAAPGLCSAVAAIVANGHKIRMIGHPHAYLFESVSFSNPRRGSPKYSSEPTCRAIERLKNENAKIKNELKYLLDIYKYRPVSIDKLI